MVLMQTRNNLEASSQYEPSFASMGQVDIRAVDVGGVSSAKDDTAAISDQFIRGARLTSLTMPWETPLMRQIFGEQVQGSKLSMPLDWGNVALPSFDSTGSGVEQPAIPPEQPKVFPICQTYHGCSFHSAT